MYNICGRILEKRTASAVIRLRDAQGNLGIRCPDIPRRHIFRSSGLYTCIYMYSVCLAPFSCKKSSSFYEWAMFTCALSRFQCQECLKTCRQDIETPTFQTHVRSDLGPFESFVNTEQITIMEMFSKFRKFPDCACLQWAKFPRDTIEKIGILFSYLPWNWI